MKLRRGNRDPDVHRGWTGPRLSYFATVVICFALASVFATLVAAVIALSQSEGHLSSLLDAMVLTLDWPNALLFGREFYVANASTFLINAIGWSLVAIAVASWRTRRSRVRERAANVR